MARDKDPDRFGSELQISHCVFCRHSMRGGKCKAFPDGIPMAILDNTHDHRKPYPGDNGIRFELKPGLKSPFKD